ncbi:hypothetical protein AVEN_77959-1 [Araneus ventricosus]|uniref:Uncharacterized protein n=1 Tax=Araneus ventricosus TaxID=182803 RepID=A0A4Y2TML7_ARAVE|nr:hypothetical protein AVEN_77959-1 [Araneus ventricosus]
MENWSMESEKGYLLTVAMDGENTYPIYMELSSHNQHNSNPRELQGSQKVSLLHFTEMRPAHLSSYPLPFRIMLTLSNNGSHL